MSDQTNGGPARRGRDYEKIPGTELPDNAIHRASLWLEDFKYGVQRRLDDDLQVERLENTTLDALIAELGLAGVGGEDLARAAVFYGHSLRRSLIPGTNVEVMVPDPSGSGRTLTLADVMVSVWIDGFMHGGAAVAGKTGQSNTEMLEAS